MVMSKCGGVEVGGLNGGTGVVVVVVASEMGNGGGSPEHGRVLRWLMVVVCSEGRESVRRERL
ncbi:hypothetical protein M6B38_197520 [Iris pallida]|uniref:Uncharacterized protein n=1 Tax=Iris pallida TaxID=29817 RepID=A0AAX6EBM5_IRIPA|nr:hypothetical protein M6B38_197520 [Iris pallida]